VVVVRRQLVLSGLTLVALVFPAVAADAPEVEQARMVATKVLEETKSVLEGALKGGQPAAALGVCAAVAQNIARRHEQQGWRVRRVSEKVRNPRMQPTPRNWPCFAPGRTRTRPAVSRPSPSARRL
jgi:hypothetical protein